MTRQARFSTAATMLTAAVALAGCSTADMWPGNWRANPLMAKDDIATLTRATAPGASTFPGALANEYLSLAKEEADEYDWTNSDYFARKGLAASSGGAVPPDDVASRTIPREKVAELQAARQRLVGVLDSGGRDRAPALAARAQGRFDCWLEEQEENWQIDDISACRGQFLAAMNDLEAALRPAAAAQPVPAGAPREYRVYFEFDKANLTPEARQIVQRLAQEVGRGGSVRLELVGKADRAGTDEYNQRLSERRARTVVDELVRAGVPRDRISARAVGESQPPVPTPDGVREPRNRVVELTVR